MKPYLYLLSSLLCIYLSISTINAQTISITETNPTEMLCSGQPVKVSFVVNGTFNTGNVFQIQLSNKIGSFTTPTVIGTLSWSGVGSNTNLQATAIIPITSAAGTGYRIRIVSTNPAVTATNTFKQFVISNRCGCNAELLEKEWDLSFGGSGSDNLLKIINTSDGGYFLAGTSSSPISGNKTVGTNGLGDYYVVKLDSLGAIKWQFSYGGTMNEELKSVLQLPDGGFLLVGFSQSSNDGNKTALNQGVVGTYDYWIVRLSSTGSKILDRTFGGSGSDFAYDVKPASDGNYWVIGSTASAMSGNKTTGSYGGSDFWLIKINTSGMMLSENIYGGTADDVGLRILNKPDGNIILGGYSRSVLGSGTKTTPNYGLSDYWLLELNNTAVQISDYSFGGNGEDIFQDMIITTDDKVLLTGTSESGISGNKTTSNYGTKDMWMLKTDFTTIDWQKNYGTSSIDPSMTLKETTDGSYIICGSALGIDGNKTSPSYGSNDMWIIGIDANGNEIAQKTFGGSLYDQANSITYTADGNFIIGGYSQSAANSGNKSSANYGMEDYWIVKLKTLPMRYSLDRTDICQLSVDTARVIINCNNLGSNPILIQLSDTTGSFDSPINLASIIPIVSSLNIPYSVPTSITPGNYKLRLVLSGSPSLITDTLNISIRESPDLSSLTSVCNVGKNFAATSLQTYATKQWQLNNVNISGETNNQIFPIQFGQYKLVTSVGSCSLTTPVFTVSPANINSSTSLTLFDGVERFLCDNITSNVIAKVKDDVGGNALGITSANLFVEPTVVIASGQTFARRHWDITPISSGVANVTIYISQSDFDHYNNNTPLIYPKMPVNATDTIGKKNIVLMLCHGTSTTKLPGTYSGATELYNYPNYTLTWNSAINMWEMSFDVTAFSGIFLKTNPPVVLPVELTSFSAKYDEAKSVVLLNWNTATELNCNNFEIQRSNHSTNQFETIGEMSCINQQNNNYQFADNNYIQGDNYYRLKQIDNDESYTYSSIALVQVRTEKQSQNEVWFSENLLHIQFAQPINFKLIALDGKIMMDKNFTETPNEPIYLSNIPKGIYIAQIITNNGNVESYKLIR